MAKPGGNVQSGIGADRVSATYRRLRELIVHGRLAPGTRVIETDLATKLGVSRTPVRAALLRLQQEGYIKAASTGQRARPSVAPLTREDADELFNIIAEIEGLAARFAALRSQAERAVVVADLERMNSQYLGASKTSPPDGSRIYDLDEAFHARYVEAGAGPRLRALHHAIKPQAERYIRVYISVLTDQIETSATEHNVIIGALKAGEADVVQRAVQTNWRNAAQRLAPVIETVGERGSW